MKFIHAFIDIFADMSLYMIIGMLLTGILHVVMKKDTVAKYLGPKSRMPAVKAAALGVPLPLCSCGVLPTTVYLSQGGATTSAVMAFLISTPQTGVDSIIATFGMMGLVFAIYRPIAAFISGVAGGVLIQKIAGIHTAKELQAEDQCQSSDCSIEEHKSSCSGEHCSTDCVAEAEPAPTVSEKIKSMLRYAFVDFIDDIAVHFLVGVLIAALITLIIPTGFFESINVSSGILAMLVMLVIGLPMYICSTSSIPIALALMAKGISPGAAFVFLFAGPATNAASLTVLAKSLGKKTVAVYLAVTAVSAVVFGLLFDAIIEWFSLPMPEFAVESAAHGVGWLKIVTGVIFAAVLVRSVAVKLIRRFKTRSDIRDDSATVIMIENMTCEHCAKAVREALQQCHGVQSVSVDVKHGKAYVHGNNLSLDEIQKAIIDAGYNVKSQ